MEDVRNLHFINSKDEPTLLARDVSLEEAVRIIHEFLDYHNFKSYYTRTWFDENGKWFDVGSWSEFFLWGDMKEAECQNEMSKDTKE